MKAKVITSVTLASILATSTAFVTGKKAIEIKKENEELKTQLEFNKVANKSHIEEVKEINKDNCKLILYESSKGQYIKTLEEDSIIPVKSKLETYYSYKIEIDLSKAKVMEINNITYVEIDYNTIKLSSISIDQPKITNQTNLISQFKGNSISEINNQILIQSYEEIEQHVAEEFKLKQDTFKINLQNKVSGLYQNLDNVIVRYN